MNELLFKVCQPQRITNCLQTTNL